jgi:hypothetical protein
VEPLRQALQGVQGEIAVDVTFQRLRKLPMGALAPAIDETIAEFDSKPRQDFVDGAWRVSNSQTPNEQAVHGFLRRITTTFPKDFTDEAERNLQRRYDESRKEKSYFDSFIKLRGRRGQVAPYNQAVQENWERIQEEGREQSIDDEAVATNWRTLRALLAQEKTFERTTKDTILRQFPFIDSPSLDQRIAGTQHLMQQASVYARVLEEQADQRAVTTGQITETVTVLQDVSPQESARILWDSVLTDTEKALLREEREKFSQAQTLLAASTDFSSHTDPDYRAFIDGYRRWDRQFLESLFGIDAIEKALIGDYESVPLQTKHALQNPTKDITIYQTGNQVEISRGDFLRSYVCDVATVFLTNDFPPPQAA